MPAAPAPSVQVFGREDSQPTRAALRFFKERRITVHFVDLRRKPIAPGELGRFVAKLGAAALATAKKTGELLKDAGKEAGAAIKGLFQSLEQKAKK